MIVEFAGHRIASSKVWRNFSVATIKRRKEVAKYHGIASKFFEQELSLNSNWLNTMSKFVSSSDKAEIELSTLPKWESRPRTP